MKLATYKDGSRDGQLVVVSRDLSSAHYATGIAHRLQQVLDDWNFLSPQLQDLYDALNKGKARHAFPFAAAQCMAPLPRAYQRVDACAYLSHAQRLYPAAVPEGGGVQPLMRQAGSDDFLGPRDAIVGVNLAQGIDFGAALAVVTSDVARGATATQALDGIRLVMLANNVSLRQLNGLGPASALDGVQSHPATAYGPVAVTLDELGDAWQQGRVHLTLQITWNGRKIGMCEAGPEMAFDFGQLIAHVCTTRPVRAGSIFGSGTVSNKDTAHGYACIAEKRALETLQDGQPHTEFMQWGDTLLMEAKGPDGSSVFGAIEQELTSPPVAGARTPR